jgi:hypothetical protein
MRLCEKSILLFWDAHGPEFSSKEKDMTTDVRAAEAGDSGLYKCECGAAPKGGPAWTQLRSRLASAMRHMGALPKRTVSNVQRKALEYQVNPRIFWSLYAVSFLPFHAGIYLMLSGSGIVCFNLHSFLHFDFQHIDITRRQVILGLLVNRFGWLLPYLYVEIFGRKLPWYFHAAIWFWIVISVVLVFHS